MEFIKPEEHYLDEYLSACRDSGMGKENLYILR